MATPCCQLWEIHHHPFSLVLVLLDLYRITEYAKIRREDLMDFDIKRFNGFSENEWILWQSPCLRRKKSPAFLSHFLYVLPLRTLAQRCLLLGVEAGSGCVPRLQRPPSAPLPLRLKDGVCVRKSIHCQYKRDEISVTIS